MSRAELLLAAGRTGPAPPRASASGLSVQAPGAALFVWGIWGLLLLLAVAFVARYGRNVPSWDDFTFVAFWTGKAPVWSSWLWAQHNEHRIPLVKLVFVALLKLSGLDFRSGMYFNVAVLGVLALAMIRAARAVRGHTAYADAFFPLSLLHLGHCENLLFFSGVHFTLVSALPALLLLLIVRRGNRLTPRTAALAGGVLLLLPLCGGPGLAYVPALTVWLGYAGLAQWRSGERARRRAGVLLVVAALAALAMTGIYFVGYQTPHHRAAPGLGAAFLTATQYLTLSFGRAAGLFWPVFGFVLVGLGLASAGLLAAVWFRVPAERLRAAGLLCFLAAAACPALAVGWGRSGFGPLAGFTLRYVSAASVAACCLYFVWVLYGPRSVGHFMQTSLFTASACVFALNCQEGLNYGKPRQEQFDAFVRDLEAQEPLYVLLRKYTPFLHHTQDHLAAYLRELHAAEVGVFRRLQLGPPLTDLPLSEPPEVRRAEWDGETARGAGRVAHLTYSLPGPQYVAGIRITYEHANQAGGNPNFQLCWKRPEQTEFPEGQCLANGHFPTGPAEQTVTFWIGDTVDRFRLSPDDQPFTFRVKQVTLLVHAEGI